MHAVSWEAFAAFLGCALYERNSFRGKHGVDFGSFLQKSKNNGKVELI